MTTKMKQDGDATLRENFVLKKLFCRCSAQHPETHFVFDLLWKFYEKNGNYRSAAKFLLRLAERHRCVKGPKSGPKPTTYAFTTPTPAFYVVGHSIFKVGIFFLKMRHDIC
jgi:hypothetical protein